MKRFLLAALLLAGTTLSFAQTRIGIEVGISAPTLSNGTGNPDNTYKHTSDPRPAITAYYQRKIDKHIYIGARVGLEGHSIYFSNTDTVRADIKHKSTYLNIMPNIDFGLGRHQYIHIYTGIGLGFLTNGNQTTYIYDISNPVAKNTYNSTSDISSFILRPAIGLRQHFPLTKNWHLTLNESFALTVSDLTQVSTLNSLRPGYLTFQMGVMRKFHRPRYMR